MLETGERIFPFRDELLGDVSCESSSDDGLLQGILVFETVEYLLGSTEFDSVFCLPDWCRDLSACWTVFTQYHKIPGLQPFHELQADRFYRDAKGVIRGTDQRAGGEG